MTCPSQVEVHAALAQIAVYRADWDVARAEAAVSAELAEREGLEGKLCFPYSMRGVLLWHDGDLDAAIEMLGRAFESAEQVGRSEVAFESLHWLAGAQRDRGDHADADQTLARALDLCERAGLIAQSVEATAARAVNLSLAGRADAAREQADAARSLADRLRYPVGRAAALEATAVTADPADREQLLAEAATTWKDLGRPADAERVTRLLTRVE